MKLLRIFLIGLIFTLGCDRSPSVPKVKVRLILPSNGGGGLQAPGLPSSFTCFVIGIRESTDTDSSHCLISVNDNSFEFPVTSAFGPFQNNQVVELTVPSGPTVFGMLGYFSCSGNTITLSGNHTLAFAAVDLKPGANTVNLNVPLVLTDPLVNGTVTACQGVININ